MSLKKSIEKLRLSGMSYNKISKKLKCSKSVISYHLNPDVKYKSQQTQRRRMNQHPYAYKVKNFRSTSKIKPSKKGVSPWRKSIMNRISDFRKSNRKNSPALTIEDILSKFGEKPRCYLTGELINIYEPTTYHFDHIIPSSKGGNNTIDNLGICTKAANVAKSDLTIKDFIKLCKQVYLYHIKNKKRKRRKND